MTKKESLIVIIGMTAAMDEIRKPICALAGGHEMILSGEIVLPPDFAFLADVCRLANEVVEVIQAERRRCSGEPPNISMEAAKNLISEVGGGK